LRHVIRPGPTAASALTVSGGDFFALALERRDPVVDRGVRIARGEARDRKEVVQLGVGEAREQRREEDAALLADARVAQRSAERPRQMAFAAARALPDPHARPF